MCCVFVVCWLLVFDCCALFDVCFCCLKALLRLFSAKILGSSSTLAYASSRKSLQKHRERDKREKKEKEGRQDASKTPNQTNTAQAATASKEKERKKEKKETRERRGLARKSAASSCSSGSYTFDDRLSSSGPLPAEQVFGKG